MSWTDDAAAALREIDGVLGARISEASDGMPGRSVFRAFLEIDAAASGPALLDAALAAIASAGGSRVPGGTIECVSVHGDRRRQVLPDQLLDPESHSELRSAGGALQVSSSWLRRHAS